MSLFSRESSDVDEWGIRIRKGGDVADGFNEFFTTNGKFCLSFVKNFIIIIRRIQIMKRSLLTVLIITMVLLLSITTDMHHYQNVR